MIRRFARLCSDLYPGPPERLQIVWSFTGDTAVVTGGDVTSDRAVCVARFVTEGRWASTSEDTIEGTLTYDIVVPPPLWNAPEPWSNTSWTGTWPDGWESSFQSDGTPSSPIDLPQRAAPRPARHGVDLPRRARRAVEAPYERLYASVAACFRGPCVEDWRWPDVAEATEADAVLVQFLEKRPTDTTLLRARARLASDELFIDSSESQAALRWEELLVVAPMDPEAHLWLGTRMDGPRKLQVELEHLRMAGAAFEPSALRDLALMRVLGLEEMVGPLSDVVAHARPLYASPWVGDHAVAITAVAIAGQTDRSLVAPSALDLLAAHFPDRLDSDAIGRRVAWATAEQEARFRGDCDAAVAVLQRLEREAGGRDAAIACALQLAIEERDLLLCYEPHDVPPLERLRAYAVNPSDAERAAQARRILKARKVDAE